MCNCEDNKCINMNFGCVQPIVANADNYYTKSEVDEKIEGISTEGISEEKAQEMIDDSLQSYYDKDDIDSKLAEKQDISGMTAYTTIAVTNALNDELDAYEDKLDAHTANTNIHVTIQEKNTWNNKSDFSGDYNDLTNKPTIPTVPTNVSAFVNDVPYLKEQDLSDYAKKSDIPSIEGLASETYVQNYTYDKQTIDEKIAEGGTFDPTNYYTKSQTDNKITEATSGKADSSTVAALNDSLTAHVTNNNIHVTAAEKNTWNNKSNFSGDYNDLTNKPTIPTVPTSNTAFTNDAGYITQAALDNYATTAQLDAKQDTLTAGSGINITNNVISALGGGSTYTAGRGISITTGETADTISFNLPISAGTGVNSIVEGQASIETGGAAHAEGSNSVASGVYSHAEGMSTTASGYSSHAEGRQTVAGGYFSHAEGFQTTASGQYSHAEGYGTKAVNQSEHASGKYNISVSASTNFGDSGNTLFTVGNGRSNNATHNAFEIRENGDIYIADTNDTSSYSSKPMIKLQDYMGIKIWHGTKTEYNAIAVKDPNIIYLIYEN